jgi:hypothetical protein
VAGWLASLRVANSASQRTIADSLHAHDVLLARRDVIESELEQLASSSPWAAAIARLCCLRGIDTLSALGLCAEIGQFDRRQRDQDTAIIDIAWRAQRRLNARWRQLRHARHKPNGVVAVAIARELAGFCWEIALAD